MTPEEFKTAIQTDNGPEIARGIRAYRAAGKTNAEIYALAQEALWDLTEAEWARTAYAALQANPEAATQPQKGLQGLRFSERFRAGESKPN